MPRLPDAEDFGKRPQMAVNRNIVRTDGTAPGEALVRGLGQIERGYARVGQAEENLARASVNTGTALQKVGVEAEEKQKKYLYAQARSNLARSMMEAETALEQEPDFNKMLPAYQKIVGEARTQSMNLIQDPYMKSMFELESGDDFTRGMERVKSAAFQKENGVLRAKTEDQKNKDLDFAVNAPPEVADTLLKGIYENIDQLARRNAISPEEAVSEKRKAALQFGERKLKATPLRDRVELLKPKSQRATVSPSDIIKSTIAIEGGYSASDGASKSPVIYGINKKYHEAAFNEAKRITDEKGAAAGKAYAEQFYKKEYFDKYDIGQFRPDVQQVLFDGAINHRTDFVKQLVSAAAGGATAQDLIELRRAEYERLGKNPEYAPSLPGWNNRLAKISEEIGSPADQPYWLKILPSDVKKEQFALDTEEMLYEDIDKDPVQTLVDLDSGKYNEYLTPKDVSAFKKQAEKQIEEIDGLQMGYAFATGLAQLNKQDEKQKKAFNNYYEKQVVPQLSQIQDQTQRNMAIVSIVGNARAIPDHLKGDIAKAAISTNKEEVIAAADLVDRISLENPYLYKDIASEKDMARLSMINDRLDVGIPFEEARVAVDNQLDPKNSVNNEQINKEIAQITKDGFLSDKTFRKRTVDVFSNLFDYLPGVGIDANNPLNQQETDSAAAAFRVAYEDSYRLTRDQKTAEDRAKKVVMGQFGRTTLNGVDQIMRYNPEKFHSIPGLDEQQNHDWMRSQMIEAANEVLSKSMNKPKDEELKKNLFLVPDPHVTARTAESGQPAYKLIYMNDGNPEDILGQGRYFSFDESIPRKKLVDEAGTYKYKYAFQKGMLGRVRK